MAFEVYASGEYSLTDLTGLLEAFGLRTRQTAKCVPASLSRTQIHRMLRNEFTSVWWRGMA